MDTPYPTELFTRQQIADLTGIDDATLNYWMREDVLRPSAGGAGRGSHRRFSYEQVNLAGLLFHLKDYGIGLSSLRQIADRFHGALAYMGSVGISRANWEAVSDLIFIRKQIDERGHHIIYPAADEKVLPKLQRHQEYSHMSPEVHVNWKQAIKYHRSRPTPTGSKVSDNMVKLVVNIDLAEYDRQYPYFSTITSMNLQDPETGGETGYFSTSQEYWYRDDAGQWHLTFSDSDAAKHSIIFLGVDMERLTYRIWGGRDDSSPIS